MENMTFLLMLGFGRLSSDTLIVLGIKCVKIAELLRHLENRMSHAQNFKFNFNLLLYSLKTKKMLGV